MKTFKYRNKRRIQIAEIRQLRSRRKRKTWLNKKRQSLLGKSLKQREFLEAKSEAFVIKPPTNFSLRRETELVFKFIDKLKSLKDRNSVKSVFISLKHCTYISSGGIALMISAIRELKTFGVKVSGSYPSDKNTRSKLERSGFFNFVIGYVSEENKYSLNTILQQGTSVVDPAMVAPLVLKAMNIVWGKPYRNPRVQSLLIELMANTVNHAFKSNKHTKWYLSMSSEPEKNKVYFTFIDNGQGINKTLNLKFADKIRSLLLNGNDNILEAAFDGKFGSRTKERKRGRGLPNVKRCFVENYITNLIVITNNVYLDYQKGNTKILNHEFEGTCYYWELDLNCVKWNIL